MPDLVGICAVVGALGETNSFRPEWLFRKATIATSNMRPLRDFSFIMKGSNGRLKSNKISEGVKCPEVPIRDVYTRLETDYPDGSNLETAPSAF